MNMCRVMDIPVEIFHEEMGAGFMEASLAYDKGIAAADKAVIFKTFAKALAQRHNMMITFMARWSNEADGQSGHIHLSLRGKDGSYVFYDPSNSNNHHMSLTMRHFLGGLQTLMPELLLMLAPNVNSFKRLLPGLFSPVAATWGWENRTCALRVIPGSQKSLRIECRTPGSDANPYLSMACLLGAGLYGIKHGLEPGEPEAGNVYNKLDQVPDQYRFPATFAEAIDRFLHSEVAAELFGKRFVETFAFSRRSQLQEFQRIVTDAELRRFFEFA
jgi:glutamine synthetase